MEVFSSNWDILRIRCTSFRKHRNVEMIECTVKLVAMEMDE